MKGSMNTVSKALLAFLGASLLALATVAEAADRLQVCAKYRTGYGWSDGYRVQATKIKGSELNRATGSWEYNSLATYVVIFWDRDQASVIELSWPFLGPMGTEGEDQRGTRWEISTSSLCF